MADGDAPEREALGSFDLTRQVGHLLSVGQTRRAREVALSLVARDPESSAAHFVLSQVLLASGEVPAALAAAGEAVRLGPEDAVVHYGHARALLAAGRFAEAERATLESIRLDPDDADAHLLLARLLDVWDREADALAAVENALRLEPESAEAHELRSHLLLQLKPRDRRVSAAAARRALALDPDSADAHAVLGTVHLREGQVQEAEERFRAALLLDPAHGLARRGLAESVMSRSRLYAPFLRYSLWMEQAGTAAQIAVVAGLWVFASSVSAWLRTQPDLAAWRAPFTLFYLALCAYTWFARPITRWILSREHPWLREVDAG